MDLHRAHKTPDWLKVPASQRNGWQKVAAATHGAVTIGNFFSLLGLASVPYGLWLITSSHRPLFGLIVLLAGRSCDLLDGWLANKTGTKSPLGEIVDAAFDKLSIGLTVLILAIASVLPWWALFLLVLPHAVVGVLALLAWLRGRAMHPSRAGKLSMAVAWLSLAAFVLAHFHGSIRGIAVALITISFGFGAVATAGYVSEFRGLATN